MFDIFLWIFAIYGIYRIVLDIFYVGRDAYIPPEGKIYKGDNTYDKFNQNNNFNNIANSDNNN